MRILLDDNEKDSKTLRRPAKKITNFDDPALLILTQHMHDLCLEPNTAGIAATQLGSKFRVFALQCNKNKPVEFYYNPKIVEKSIETKIEPEGCLSVPGKYAEIERSERIIIEYQDNKGKKQVAEFIGFYAKAVQHEIDHLDGILYVDRAKEVHTQPSQDELFRKALADQLKEKLQDVEIVEN